MSEKQNCDNCAFRAKYDNNPKSLLGKIWRWHINWCPGWKAYFNSADDEKKNQLREQYNLKV